MIRYLISRIGCLMFLVGAVVLALGIAAESSGEPAFNLVFIGAGLMLLGLLLWSKLRRKKRRNTRFSMFRRRERREDQETEDEWDDQYDDW
jgi:LPXTG-motif cell wall-anchored protein